MATISRIRPHLPEALLHVAVSTPVAPAALLLLAMAFGGLGLSVLGRPPTAPEASPPATVTGTVAADLPRGDIPFIGDPIRDLTIWWSTRLSDANKAGLDSMRGRTLTPIDPMADDVIKTLVLKLVDTAVAHLFKELYFRETGEWLGEEVHREVPKIEQRAPLDRAA